jgi:hypothetical protein
MLVTRFSMFTDTSRPVYLPLKETDRTTDIGYSDIPWLHSIDGLGDLPQSTILTNKTILGTTAIGRTIESRTLTVHLIFPPGWNPQVFRRQLYDEWNLDLYEMHTFRIEYGGHQYVERYIDGFIETIVPDIFTSVPMLHISILCPNPNYYLMPYAPLLLDNGVAPLDADGNDIPGVPFVPRTDVFNTTVETGFLIQITPQAGGTYTDVQLMCDTGPGQNGVQFFLWPNSKLIGASFSGAKYIQGGDIITIDTTPGMLVISLTRDGINYNLLPFTTITGGVMRVIPTTNEYRMQLLPLGLVGLVGTVTCKELYLGV